MPTWNKSKALVMEEDRKHFKFFEPGKAEETLEKHNF
jgi:hypothetical protein